MPKKHFAKAMNCVAAGEKGYRRFQASSLCTLVLRGRISGSAARSAAVTTGCAAKGSSCRINTPHSSRSARRT